jgi:hypothetical protein
VGEGDCDQGFECAQRESFENTRDLLGDLLGAKNAGVTPDALPMSPFSSSF